MAPGCKPGGLRLYVGSNPTPSTMSDEGGLRDEAGEVQADRQMIEGGKVKVDWTPPSSFRLRPSLSGRA